jgi:hypothetical protein
MTDSQFETLRQELRGMRVDFDARFDALRKDIDERFEDVSKRLTKLEVRLDEKPDKAFVFQTLLSINASFIALIGLTVLVFRTFLIPA